MIHRLGTETIELATATGAIVARHRRAPDGAGRVTRDAGHVIVLERSVLASFDSSRPCTHKTRRPISEAALAESARLRGYPVQADPDEVRFAKLQRRMPGVSQKMLSVTLRQLTTDSLVARRVEPTVLPKVYYRLTNLGLSLEVPLSALRARAEEHMAVIDEPPDTR
ncbi:winged helix-turn-helix transcriptional regulator [Nocardia sp. NPDC059228]|uniref:winged helix-turn-helix transcriptional regulator n=1 Tax=Nocardia sp. NPDC059228 TaxID=3346777 RepID=UPI0036803664